VEGPQEEGGGLLRVFARFDPRTSRSKVLRGGQDRLAGKPAPIPAYEVTASALVTSDLQYDPCPMIQEGAMVSVTHGALRGVVGRLVRKDPQKARLILSVDLIGQAVSVEVDAADVKPYYSLLVTSSRRAQKRVS
jgi:transcription antitermination factor NusG